MKQAHITTGALKHGLFKLHFKAMGTTCEVQFQCSDINQANSFKEKALGWVKDFEDQYSRFKDTSIVGKINLAAGEDWTEVDLETESLFDLCDRFHFITQGLFDPTTLPVQKIWDYKAEVPRIPSQEEINQALSLVGWDKFERLPGKVRLKEKGMGIDLGGIGKEYAVDRVVIIAKEHGITDLLVNFGGDVYALGHPPNYTHWHVGIEDPGKPGHCWGSLALSNTAVASSGDYRRYFEINGERFGHIVDHRKGFPIANKVQHVSIVAQTCTEAGILATACCLLGETEGMELLNGFFGAEGCIHTEFKRIDSYAIHQHMVSE